MKRHPRLGRIPGMTRQQDTTSADEQMATTGLASLPFLQALRVIEAHLSARPDIDTDALETFSNAIGRLAHTEARRGRS